MSMDLPEKQDHNGERDLEWVAVMETVDLILLAMAKGLLEDSGIKFYVLGEDLRGKGGVSLPSCRVLVSSDCEAEARDLLRVLEEPDEVTTDPAGSASPAS